MPNFTVRSTKPSAGNKCYMTKKYSNGWSNCIRGKVGSTGTFDPDLDVYANCVGHACGRFNEIYNEITGNIGMKYNTLTCNAENFIERALSVGLKVVGPDKAPTPGGIMVFQKGSTLGSSDGAGHVMIPEIVYNKDKVYTSESGYNSKSYWNQTRTRGADNRWGMGSSYTYRGCIVNPAVKDDPTPTPEPTPSTRKYKVGDNLIFNGVLYADSYGSGAGQSRSNFACTVTRVNYNANATKPYNINNGLGWVAEADLSTQPTPAPTPTHFNPGDTVTVNGVGKAASDGTGASTGSYKNRKAKVIYYRAGAKYPYALNCNNNMNGVTAWFTESSVK